VRNAPKTPGSFFCERRARLGKVVACGSPTGGALTGRAPIEEAAEGGTHECAKEQSSQQAARVGAGFILILPLLGAGATPTLNAIPARLDPAVQPRVDQAYGKLPLTFEANRGQTDSQVSSWPVVGAPRSF